jgi:ribonuclease HI
MILSAFFDGLCEPVNPAGCGCGGFLIEPNPDYHGKLEGNFYFGRGAGMTNNVAEYLAAIATLKQIYQSGYRGPILLQGDSRIVIYQYTGKYQCHAPHLKKYLDRLFKARGCFEELILKWVDREHNQEADIQSRMAYERVTGRKCPVWQRNRVS